MDLPNYLDYGKMYEMNPGAFWQAQNQMDLARQFQDQKLVQEREVSRQKQLANMFDEQNNPLRLEEKRISNEKLGYETSDAGVKSRINKATEGLQLDAAQKELVKKAKQSELDQLELLGQQMAYSTNPQERAQGEAMMRMHKDFMKIRAQGEESRTTAAQAQKHALALADRQAGHQRSLEQMRIDAGKYNRANSTKIKNVADAIAAGKMNFEKAAVYFYNEANNAEDPTEQARLMQVARTYEQMHLNSRMAGVQGKPDVSQMGVPTQQVQPVIPQQVGPAHMDPRASRGTVQRSLSDVQKMYPGVPPEKLKEAYKKKFGVDLQ